MQERSLANTRSMTVDTVEFLDPEQRGTLFTVEIGGQDDDVLISRETANYMFWKLGLVLGKDVDNDPIFREE